MVLLEKILKAVANKRRLNILKLLTKNREMNVAEISEGIHLSFKSTSRHLAILSSLNLVSKTQKQLFVYYRLSQANLPLVKFILPYTPYSHE